MGKRLDSGKAEAFAASVGVVPSMVHVGQDGEPSLKPADLRESARQNLRQLGYDLDSLEPGAVLEVLSHDHLILAHAAGLSCHFHNPESG